MLSLIRSGRVGAVHDLSDGGLAVALAEMAMASGIGATIEKSAVEGSAHGFLVRRGSGPLCRYRAPPRTPTRSSRTLAALASRRARLGTTGGDDLDLVGEPPIPLAMLRTAFEFWLPAYMDGKKGERT